MLLVSMEGWLGWLSKEWKYKPTWWYSRTKVEVSYLSVWEVIGVVSCLRCVVVIRLGVHFMFLVFYDIPFILNHSFYTCRCLTGHTYILEGIPWMTFWPRMFYRSGWLRCDVFNYGYPVLVFWFVFISFSRCAFVCSCWVGIVGWVSVSEWL